MDRDMAVAIILIERLLEKLSVVLNIPHVSESYPADMEYYHLNLEAREFMRKMINTDEPER